MPLPRKKIIRTSLFGALIGIAALVKFSVPLWRWYYLSQCDAKIEAATKRSDAKGFAELGRAYSEKARFSRAFRLIPDAEYDRQFALSIQAHDKAIALSPTDVEAHFSRGRTYYDRATVEPTALKQKKYYSLAEMDFGDAIQHLASHGQALEWRGLARSSNEDLDGAIEDFEVAAKLNPDGGTSRVADALCQRGSDHQGKKETEAAIADYERSIAANPTRDGCSCEPYEPLVALYLQNRDYAKGWDAVQKARGAGRRIDPELLNKLKAASGRSQ